MTDDLPALSPEARRVLDSLRGAHDPPAGAAERARPRIDARVRRERALGRVVRWGAVVGVAGLALFVGARALDAPPAPRSASPRLAPVVAPTPAPAPPVAAPAPPVAAPAPPVAAPAPAPPAVAEPAPAVRAPTAAPACTLDAELRAIRAADAALRGGDAAGALRATRDLARRCPRGAMVEEREAIRVMALCRSGAPSAEREARRFAATYARSPARQRVEATCAQR